MPNGSYKNAPLTEEVEQIWFSLTDDCNMRCRYCFVPKDKNYMCTGVIEKALDLLFLSPGDNKKAILFGGEPLLDLKLVCSLTKLARKKADLLKKSFQLGVGTNCLYLTRKATNFLKKEDFQISVTLDGNRKTHDKYRITKEGEPTYDTVTKNLAKLQKEVPASRICCLLGVYHEEVENLVDNFLHVCEKIGVESINIEPIQTNHPWTKTEISRFKFNLLKIFNYILDKIEKNNFVFINSLNRALENKMKNRVNQSVFRKNLVVFPDGKITINPFLYYLDKKYIIGDVLGSIDPAKAETPFNLRKDIVDFNIIRVRDHFCNKMAEYLINKSKTDPKFSRYVGEATSRIFE